MVSCEFTKMEWLSKFSGNHSFNYSIITESDDYVFIVTLVFTLTVKKRNTKHELPFIVILLFWSLVISITGWQSWMMIDAPLSRGILTAINVFSMERNVSRRHCWHSGEVIIVTWIWRWYVTQGLQLETKKNYFFQI